MLVNSKPFSEKKFREKADKDDGTISDSNQLIDIFYVHKSCFNSASIVQKVGRNHFISVVVEFGRTLPIYHFTRVA